MTVWRSPCPTASAVAVVRGEMAWISGDGRRVLVGDVRGGFGLHVDGLVRHVLIAVGVVKGAAGVFAEV